MLIKLNNENSINPDYIISLYCKKEEFENEVYKVLARMIDGSVLIIKEFNNKNDAEIYYNGFIQKTKKD